MSSDVKWLTTKISGPCKLYREGTLILIIKMWIPPSPQQIKGDYVICHKGDTYWECQLVKTSVERMGAIDFRANGVWSTDFWANDETLTKGTFIFTKSAESFRRRHSRRGRVRRCVRRHRRRGRARSSDVRRQRRPHRYRCKTSKLQT